jgi:flagellar basal body-associated protein FliL
MKGKKIKKIILIVVIAGVLGLSYAAYLYFMPHRDVQNTKAFAELSAAQLVNEYLLNPTESNEKYLSSDGNSKVLIINGTVHSKTRDQNNQVVILLKDEESNAGVSCTFLSEVSDKLSQIKEGDELKVKGAIRQGASYDEDLEMYEDVILEECDILE